VARRPRHVAGLSEDQRSDARERAMMLLYEAEAKGVSVVEVVAAQVTPPDELAVLLAQGVEQHRADLDQAISAHSKGWTMARMPALDRTILRIGAFELRHRPDVPVAVVLNEAIELAKRFSTDDSSRFVNGVLAALVPVLRAA
jgi:N utilization substance protein B